MSCEQAAQLRSEHKDIVPSPNLNKAHWRTIFLDGTLKDALRYKLVDGSYALALTHIGDQTRQRRESFLIGTRLATAKR